jgi:hypothetical protein
MPWHDAWKPEQWSQSGSPFTAVSRSNEQTRNNPFLANGSQNTHSRGNGQTRVIHELFEVVIYIRFARKFSSGKFNHSAFVGEFNEVRFRSQVGSRGICGGQNCTVAGFLRVLQFFLTILIPTTVPCPIIVIQGWYNGPNSGRRTKWTQSHPIPRIKERQRSPCTLCGTVHCR